MKDDEFVYESEIILCILKLIEEVLGVELAEGKSL